ncbi:MAG: DUF1684 domain-containing protein [Acidobacteria bacterium]|nr:DUF1684 domain-containing protein [Acidobacteriota bacterium]
MVTRKVWLIACQLFVLAADPHTQSVEAWRKKYEEGLKAPYTGWLSVAGLFWLKPGENSVGSADANDIVLPRGTAKAGMFLFDGKTVRYRDSSGSVRALRTDTPGTPDTVEIDGMRLVAIERNGKFGIRLRDAQSKMRREYTGSVWYPINAKYKVRAKFIPHAYKRTINFADMTGNTQKMVSPGLVEFTLNGQVLRLEPVEDEGQLFFVFKDKTANHGTYGAGRMLYAPLPVNGIAEIDFNVAKNPPCVFTPYATCPLPPKQNILPIAIEAGEKMPAGH